MPLVRLMIWLVMWLMVRLMLLPPLVAGAWHRVGRSCKGLVSSLGKGGRRGRGCRSERERQRWRGSRRRHVGGRHGVLRVGISVDLSRGWKRGRGLRRVPSPLHELLLHKMVKLLRVWLMPLPIDVLLTPVLHLCRCCLMLLQLTIQLVLLDLTKECLLRQMLLLHLLLLPAVGPAAAGSVVLLLHLLRLLLQEAPPVKLLQLLRLLQLQNAVARIFERRIVFGVTRRAAPYISCRLTHGGASRALAALALLLLLAATMVQG